LICRARRTRQNLAYASFCSGTALIGPCLTKHSVSEVLPRFPKSLRFLLGVFAVVLFQNAAYALDRCSSIVSLAPSVTELLFDLGLEDRIVGATRFCRYPAKANDIPRVGGYLDLNLEQIITKRPSIVFALKEGQEGLKPLKRFGIETVLLDHSSLSGIKESYLEVARRCDLEAKAKARLAELNKLEVRVRSLCGSTAQTANKRVLVVVGRTREGSENTGLYISGSDGFYSDILKVIGATNVYQGSTAAIPAISTEGLLKLSPDFIIDIVNVDDRGDLSRHREFWNQFPNLPAATRGDVLVLAADYASIPGPRYVKLLEDLARVLCE
jgi:iron complex transport system substrate-binding protein